MERSYFFFGNDEKEFEVNLHLMMAFLGQFILKFTVRSIYDAHSIFFKGQPLARLARSVDSRCHSLEAGLFHRHGCSGIKVVAFQDKPEMIH